MIMMMKREREVDSITMANYLMLLSRGSEFQNTTTTTNNNINYSSSAYSNRVFECKTCNRQFSSFQALGGHRASHKKPRLMVELGSSSSSPPPKPKAHECSICGLEFAIGQALGGHMRRHRATAITSSSSSSAADAAAGTSSVDNHNSSSSQNNDDGNKRPTNNNHHNNNSSSKRKTSSSSSSVLFLDLNLTPFENDLEFLKIGQPTTTCTLVHCFN